MLKLGIALLGMEEERGEDEGLYLLIISGSYEGMKRALGIEWFSEERCMFRSLVLDCHKAENYRWILANAVLIITVTCAPHNQINSQIILYVL